MAANGRGNMRPAGRSPPFLAIGLFVALIILGFNYWTLSARNGEQSNEIILMESELRLVNAKKTSAEKRSEAISDKVSDLEKQLNQQKEIIANNAAELANVEKEKESFNNRVNELEIEVKGVRDQQLPSCEAEKSNIEREVQELKALVDTYKNKQCTESDCKGFIRQSRDNTLEDVYKVAGADALISMYRKNNDLGSYQGQIAGLAARMDQAAAQGNAHVQQQQQQADSQQQQQQQQPDLQQQHQQLDSLQQQQADLQQQQQQKQPYGQPQQPDILQQQQQADSLQQQQQADLQQQHQQQPDDQQHDQHIIDSQQQQQPLVPDAQVVPAPGADIQDTVDATNQNVNTNVDNAVQDPTSVDTDNAAAQMDAVNKHKSGSVGDQSVVTSAGNHSTTTVKTSPLGTSKIAGPLTGRNTTIPTSNTTLTNNDGTDIGNADGDGDGKAYDDDDDDDEEDDPIAQGVDNDDLQGDYDYDVMETAVDKPDDLDTDAGELINNENSINQMFQRDREVQDTPIL